MSEFLLIYFGIGVPIMLSVIWLSMRYQVDSVTLNVLLMVPLGALSFPFGLIDVVLGIVLVFIWPIVCLYDVATISARRERAMREDEVMKAQLRERQAIHVASGKKSVRKIGVTVTRLNPSGKVEIDGNTWDAVSLHGFINANELVIVRDRVGDELKVEPHDQESCDNARP